MATFCAHRQCGRGRPLVGLGGSALRRKPGEQAFRQPSTSRRHCRGLLSPHPCQRWETPSPLKPSSLVALTNVSLLFPLRFSGHKRAEPFYALQLLRFPFILLARFPAGFAVFFPLLCRHSLYIPDGSSLLL